MKPHFVSRTAHDLDNKCRRARYNSTILMNGGVAPAFDGPELTFGTALHAGHETLWTSNGNVEAAALAVRQAEHFNRLHETHQYLVEALIRAYAKVRYPQIFKYWRPLFIEREVQLQLGESTVARRAIIFLAKPDAILQHRQIGLNRYEELKSTKIFTPNYIDSWNYSVQLTGGMRAVKETLGVDVDDAVMRFFYKGVEAEDYLRSPFTSAWRRSVVVRDAGPSPEWDIGPAAIVESHWQYEPKRPQSWKGWERFNVPESGMTPAEWVSKLPTDTLEDQLPQTQPLMFNQKLVDAWIRQITYRERQIADTVELLDAQAYRSDGAAIKGYHDALDRVFPMNTSACRPAMGFPCPFISLCWNEHAARDPLNHGFVKRIPHHESERKAMENEE